MTTTLIISLCLLILLAYTFDLSSKHTKIPTVILLLILGFSMHQAVDFFEIEMINLEPLLPIVGTIGLILIVLEAGLDLELNKNKKKILKNSFSAPYFHWFLLFAIGFAINYFTSENLMKSMLNALPFVSLVAQLLY